MKVLRFLFFFTILPVAVNAQTTLENNPASIKWQQVNTPHFNILFPKGFEAQAQRMANTLEVLSEPETQTLKGKPPRISVLLQNQSSFSNGFVSYFPRRSEFYTMPSQDYNFTGTNDWLDMLASHEYRHVVQFQHASVGFNKLIFYLFGYSVFAASSQAAVPQWFWEGDAVSTETAFTHSGRGRIPNFGLVLRTNLMEGRVFNYNKQYMRSYKHNISNHYVLGYYMTSYLRRRTKDPLIWSKITDRAWRSPIVPFTFSSAIKKETGMYVSELYKQMAADLKKEWQQEIDSMILTPFDRLNARRSRAYTDYSFPQPLSDGRVVAVKSGIGDIEQLVVIDGGTEKKFFTQGIVNETGMLSEANGKVAWSEYAFDPRWLVRNYSVIKLYDLKTKRVTRISPKKSRMAGAALSPDGNYVASVRTDNAYRHTLLLLNVSTRQVVKEFVNPENDFFSMPGWSADGKRLVVLKTTRRGRSVVTIDVESGVTTELIAVGQENIGYPVLHENYLFYNSPVTGIDNIYALNIQTGKKYHVTSSRYGAYNPSVSADGKTLYYNDQSRNGLDVVKVDLDPASWRPFENNEVNVVTNLSGTLAEQEGKSDILDNVPQQQYPVKKYSKAKGLINPYSWGVYIDDNDFTRPTAGVSSRDILSTTTITGGYWFDIFERTGSWYAKGSYQGFYPILDVEIDYGHREVKTGVFDRDVKFEWTESTVLTGLRLPLLLTRSKYVTRMEIGNSVGVTLTSGFKSEISENGIVVRNGFDRFVSTDNGDTLYYLFNNRTDYGSLRFNQFSLFFSRLLKQSHRDFNPKIGQAINFEHYSTPYAGDYYGWLWAARALFYFPGIAKHHSLYFRGNYQRSYSSYKLDTYTFRNRIFKPRGFSYPTDQTFYSVSANYELPLWYPDINVGPLVNVQRVRTNFFFDYGQGTGTSYYTNFSKQYYLRGTQTVKYTSFGAEVNLDVNFLRLLPQFEIGFRTSYILENRYNNGGLVFEFLLGNISL